MKQSVFNQFRILIPTSDRLHDIQYSQPSSCVWD